MADGPSWLPDAALTRVLELMAEAVAGSRAALTYVRQNFGVGSDLAGQARLRASGPGGEGLQARAAASAGASPDPRDQPEAHPARVVGVARQPHRQHRLLAQRPGGQQGNEQAEPSQPPQ